MPDGEDANTLRGRLRDLEALLAERAAEIARARSDLAAFRIRYRAEVGLLHEQLDELERAIAEAELGEFSKLADRDAADTAGASSPAASADRAPRFTSDAVRRLFR